jgi:hypothetical protein
MSTRTGRDDEPDHREHRQGAMPVVADETEGHGPLSLVRVPFHRAVARTLIPSATERHVAGPS